MGRRIAVLVSSMDVGGAERAASNLVNAWSNRGDEVLLVSTFSGGGGTSYQIDERARFVKLSDLIGMRSNGLRSRVKRVLALRSLLRSFQPDVVVSFLTTVNVAALLATLDMEFPVIVNEQIHPPCLDEGFVWNNLRRMTYPRSDRVIMLTPEGCEWLAEAIPRASGAVIPNPVIRPTEGTTPGVPPHSIVPPNRRLLLAAGRLVSQKGFDLLIAAVRELPAACDHWTLVILGDGPEREALSSQVRVCGLDGRVLLPGRVGNIGAWYEAADLYVLSSRFEGFPGVLGEAMAQGCPVVSYDCDTGPRSMIRDGLDGVLVRPVGDVSALAAALARVMTDDSGRRKMAEHAAEILERYSPSKILTMWDRVFDEVTRKR